MNNRINKKILLAGMLLLSGLTVNAQKKSSLILDEAYYVVNNQVPYLKITTRIKVERQFLPVKGIDVSVYLDEQADDKLIGNIKTDDEGQSKLYIPASFNAQWDSSDSHTFLAYTEGNDSLEGTNTEITIKKAKLELDTSNEDGTRNIVMKLTTLENGEWLPVKEVDLKAMMRRMNSLLNVNSDEFFTTDEEGVATAEFKRDSIPGDKDGNIILVAKLDDSEDYGNLLTEKQVKWGSPLVVQDIFDERSLWATRDKAPIWLLLLAYSIVTAVWGTLLYLLIKFIRVKRLGKTESA